LFSGTGVGIGIWNLGFERRRLPETADPVCKILVSQIHPLCLVFSLVTFWILYKCNFLDISFPPPSPYTLYLSSSPISFVGSGIQRFYLRGSTISSFLFTSFSISPISLFSFLPSTHLTLLPCPTPELPAAFTVIDALEVSCE
jgi:hypothetical protein